MVSNQINFDALTKKDKVSLWHVFGPLFNKFDKRIKIFAVVCLFVLVLAVILHSIFFLETSQVQNIVFNLILYVVIGYAVAYFYYQAKIKEFIWRKFATDNNWVQVESYGIEETSFLVPPGMNAGRKIIGNHIKGNILERGFELYDFSYEIGHGDFEKAYTSSIISFKIDWSLPRMQIVSKNKDYGIGRDFLGSQEITLEGNFNNFFSVKFRKDDHINTLSVLTPEVMEDLIKYSKNYDIEVVDNRIYFITEPHYYDPEKLKEIFDSSFLIFHELTEKLQRYKKEFYEFKPTSNPESNFIVSSNNWISAYFGGKQGLKDSAKLTLTALILFFFVLIPILVVFYHLYS